MNQKGYKKLPAHPIALSDEEVEKFRGLEEETEEMYQKYGEDYTGKGDRGEDLVGQYASYEVEDFVKVLSGNFVGEDGMVKRLKDGQIMVRLYTYGQVMDQWFEPKEIQKMNDLEVAKGLSGRATIGQDQFDVSIGKKAEPKEWDAKKNDRGGRGLNSNAMGSVSGVKGNNDRARKQDRQSRGESGRKDMYGRSEGEAKQEEKNWQLFREKERDQQKAQKKKVGEAWGMKESSSWSKQETDGLEDALDGDSGWDSLADAASSSSQADSPEDDFFNSLMSELSDNLDSPNGQQSSSSSSSGGAGSGGPKETDESDDFFSSLMSDLSESMDETPKVTQQNIPTPSSDTSMSSDSDDFFASLESDLSESLAGNPGSNTIPVSNTAEANSDDDDFFANLVTDLDQSLDYSPTTINTGTSASSQTQENTEDDVFADLEADLFKSLGTSPDTKLEQKPPSVTPASSQTISDTEDDFFASLERDLNESLDNSPGSSSSSSSVVSASSESKGDAENSFFENFETELSTTMGGGGGETKEIAEDDFFASLETELSDMMSSDEDVSISSSSVPKPKTSDVESATQPSGTSANADEDFSKMTVVALKQELRDRGLKVSGKKSELIERLQQ